MVLNVSSEKEALAEYALFLRNPLAYVERKEERLRVEEGKVVVDDTVFGEFKRHLLGPGREEKHVSDTANYLEWWRDVLKGADLRKVTLRDLQMLLKTEKTARRSRIVSLKVLCYFLREEMAIRPRGQDVSLDLKPPLPRPAKMFGTKVYTAQHVQDLYAQMSEFKETRRQWWISKEEAQHVRDLVCLLAKTGMHATEAMRVASKERSELITAKDQGEIAGHLRGVHKSGHQVTPDLHLAGYRPRTSPATCAFCRRGETF